MKINEKLLNSSICCKCTKNTASSSTTEYTQIPLTEQAKKGVNFYISDNKIYAKKSCSIIVLGQVYINDGVTSTSTGVRVQLYKNGSEFNRVLFSVPKNYRMIPFGGFQINLEPNDYITVGFNSGDKTGIVCSGGTDTYITILEI